MPRGQPRAARQRARGRGRRCRRRAARASASRARGAGPRARARAAGSGWSRATSRIACGQGAGVAGRHEPSARARRRARRACRPPRVATTGRAGGQRLDERHRRALVARGVHDHVEVAVDRRHVAPPAEEVHGARRGPAGAQTRLERGALLAVADEREAAVGPRLAARGRGARRKVGTSLIGTSRPTMPTSGASSGTPASRRRAPRGSAPREAARARGPSGIDADLVRRGPRPAPTRSLLHGLGDRDERVGQRAPAARSSAAEERGLQRAEIAAQDVAVDRCGRRRARRARRAASRPSSARLGGVGVDDRGPIARGSGGRAPRAPAGRDSGRISRPRPASVLAGDTLLRRESRAGCPRAAPPGRRRAASRSRGAESRRQEDHVDRRAADVEAGEEPERCGSAPGSTRTADQSCLRTRYRSAESGNRYPQRVSVSSLLRNEIRIPLGLKVRPSPAVVDELRYSETTIRRERGSSTSRRAASRRDRGTVDDLDAGPGLARAARPGPALVIGRGDEGDRAHAPRCEDRGRRPASLRACCARPARRGSLGRAPEPEGPLAQARRAVARVPARRRSGSAGGPRPASTRRARGRRALVVRIARRARPPRRRVRAGLRTTSEARRASLAEDGHEAAAATERPDHARRRVEPRLASPRRLPGAASSRGSAAPRSAASRSRGRRTWRATHARATGSGRRYS